MSEHKMGRRETALRRYYVDDIEDDVKVELRVARLEDALEEAVKIAIVALNALEEEGVGAGFEGDAARIQELRAVLAEAT